jgi:ABC-type multidrug transport system ATPase subunit
MSGPTVKDPAGIADLRRMLQDFATHQGMTVLVSSHLLGEVEQVATHLGVLHAGELKFQGTVNELRARSLPRMRLRCDDLASARAWLHAHSHPEAFSADDWITLAVESREAPRLLHHLFTAGIEVLDMALEQSSLETLFFNLTTTVKAAA